MNPKGRREVNFVVLGATNGVPGGGQVTVIYVFSGGNEVMFCHGCAAWNDGGRTADAFVEECWRATRQGEGGT